MIVRGRGTLLHADVDALVHAVNCQGVMGNGLASQFRRTFPQAFEAYQRACAAGDVVVGRMHVVRLAAGRFLVHFPIKTTWRDRPKLEYVREGLRELVEQVRTLGIRSIAVPALGCGLGGLDWSEVEPLIREAFAALPTVKVVLFAPGWTAAALSRQALALSKPPSDALRDEVTTVRPASSLRRDDWSTQCCIVPEGVVANGRPPGDGDARKARRWPRK